MGTSGIDKDVHGGTSHGGTMLTRQSARAYRAVLQFDDADSCVSWLETVPLTRPADAHEMLSAQLGLLHATEFPALEKLRILEVLYQAARHMQERLSERYLGCALPLSIVEYSVWSSVVDLWRLFRDAYAGCLRRIGGPDAGLAPHAPLIGLRCLDSTGASIREHHRVYRAVPSALWKQLHDDYAAVEAQGLANCGVADPLADAMPARTCAGAYATVLLGHLSNPYTMSPRQMQVASRWAELWSSLVSIQASPVAPGMTPVLSVDLRTGVPAGNVALDASRPSVRYVVMEQLGQTLRRVLTLLRQGHAPRDLGLGDDVRQPGCERLLTLLYIQWCGSGVSPLPSSQRDHGEEIRACVGFDDIARQLALEAEAFRASGAAARTAYGPLTEHWNVVSINAPGFLGVARGPECETRIRHHQLVAIKRRSAAGFQLAVVQWLRREEDGEMSVGLRLLPGLPHLSPVSPAAAAEGEAADIPGVLLPAAPEMRTPATLVLPPGVFSPGKTVALTAGTPRSARLIRLAERGADFERAVFEIV